MNKYLKLAFSIAIPLIIGFAGSYFTSSSLTTWFTTINKPSFNPPNWIFGPVWTTLFIMIGVSFYLVWQKNFGKQKTLTISIFAIQLFLNFLWSLLFFSLQNPLLALIEIILLWIVILLNILIFYKISKPAAYLLIPYLLWVSFASVLNTAIYLLNR